MKYICLKKHELYTYNSILNKNKQNVFEEILSNLFNIVYVNAFILIKIDKNKEFLLVHTHTHTNINIYI